MAALDQNNQHNGKQYSGNNPDKCGTVHFEFSLSQFCVSNLILCGRITEPWCGGAG
jgi:hypothetical protein